MKKKKIVFALFFSACFLSFNLHAETWRGLYEKSWEAEESQEQTKSTWLRSGSEGGFEEGEKPDVGPGDNVPVGSGALSLILLSGAYIVGKQLKKRRRAGNEA